MSIEGQLRLLPSVDKVLSSKDAQPLIEKYGRNLTTAAARDRLNEARVGIRSGADDAPTVPKIIEDMIDTLDHYVSPSLRSVINASGVILHTNLGRSPLSESAIDEIRQVASGYSNLEYDLLSGKRGSRSVHAEAILVRLVESEAALVVNNNAAAVLLMLTATCASREVIISRGQLIEIGGGFRLPDVMKQSGVKLIEVGTTNRTHLRDYSEAINENTAAIFVAHHSNFKVVGYTAEPKLAELANLARNHNVLLLYDQGSGAYLDTTTFGLDAEPNVKDNLLDGVDIVAFSGDKLLGGPQAGILCGRSDLISLIRRHPLARAVRADKLCIAALTATLVPYLNGTASDEIPIWQMISRPVESIEETALDWVKRLTDHGIRATVVDSISTVGGGSLPGSSIPTRAVAVDHHNPVELAKALREAKPPIIGRLKDDLLYLDPRTVLPHQENMLIDLVIQNVG